MDVGRLQHLRLVTRLVLRWYLEPVDGLICVAGNHTSVFDARMIEFNHDVDRVVNRVLRPHEQAFLVLVHQDGLTARDAGRLLLVKPSSISDDNWSAAFPEETDPCAQCLGKLEAHLGLALEQAGLDDVRGYFSRRT
jgi:hypothetical protein